MKRLKLAAAAGGAGAGADRVPDANPPQGLSALVGVFACAWAAVGQGMFTATACGKAASFAL